VLVHVELDYRREVRISDHHLVGECRVAELGRSRIALENRRLLADDARRAFPLRDERAALLAH
jgi:acyl-CoA thioesterase FadM